MARRSSKKLQRERRQQQAAVIIAASDDHLRSILGLMLHRLWLYSKAEPIPAYQLAWKITNAEPLHTEREGFTQYYR